MSPFTPSGQVTLYTSPQVQARDTRDAAFVRKQQNRFLFRFDALDSLLRAVVVSSLQKRKKRAAVFSLS